MGKGKKLEQADVMGESGDSQSHQCGIFCSRLEEIEVGFAGVQFEIRSLTSNLAVFALARATDDKGDVNIGELFYWYFKLGVAGWSGMTDQDGKEVKFETTETLIMGRRYEVPKNKLLDGLPAKLIMVLGGEVQRISRLSGSDLIKLDFT